MVLATGSGKTITAIYGTVKLYEQFKKLFVIVIVPYINLADQWVENLNMFNIFPVECYRDKSKWEEALNSKIDAFTFGTVNCFAVVVNNTLIGQSFQKAILALNQEQVLVIGDECHHHSGERINHSLPKFAQFRLGLSATPFHYSDEDKNIMLKSFYGSEIYKYELIDAIRDKVLTPYDYHIVPVLLTAEEEEKFNEISAQISAAFARTKGKKKQDTRLKILLSQKARLIGSAQNKLIKLDEILNNIEAKPYSLFFCGDGSVENDESNDDRKQITDVISIAHNKGWKPTRFTARENLRERKLILEGFKDKSIKSLVAIKCLDEGVDIPSCETAFILASSSNPRQFVQRRGRILRRSPGKEKAIIYDFSVCKWG